MLVVIRGSERARVAVTAQPSAEGWDGHPRRRPEPAPIRTRACPAESLADPSGMPASPALAELESLVGLAGIKSLIRELYAYVAVQRRRQQLGLHAEPMVLHMVFKGNPGTGKTTVARLLAKMLHELGVLPRGHLVEVERADLVGEYIGHTAQKTREQIRRALGGILFIDEAYALARGGEKDFGREAIDTLVRAMEDCRDQFVVIAAGYREEMEWFLAQNPGLRSRFPIHLEFPDYTIDELMAIAQRMLQQRQYALAPSAELKLRELLIRLRVGGRDNGNARTVRNLVERAIRRQAVRLLASGLPDDRESLVRILAADLEGAAEP